MGLVNVILLLLSINLSNYLQFSDARRSVNNNVAPRSFMAFKTNTISQRACNCTLMNFCACCETVKIFYTSEAKRLCFNMVYQRNSLNFDISLDSTMIKAMSIANYRPFQMCSPLPGLLFSSVCVNILELNQFSRSITVCPRIDVIARKKRWQITYTCVSISTILPTMGAPGMGSAAVMQPMMPGTAGEAVGQMMPGSPVAGTMGQMRPSNVGGPAPSMMGDQMSAMTGAIGQGPAAAMPPAGAMGTIPIAGAMGAMPPVGAMGPMPTAEAMGAMPPAGAMGPMRPAVAIGAMPPAEAMGPMRPAVAMGSMPAAGAMSSMQATGAAGPMSAAGAMGPMPAAGAMSPMPAAGTMSPMPAAGAMSPMPAAGGNPSVGQIMPRPGSVASFNARASALRKSSSLSTEDDVTNSNAALAQDTTTPLSSAVDLMVSKVQNLLSGKSTGIERNLSTSLVTDYKDVTTETMVPIQNSYQKMIIEDSIESTGKKVDDVIPTTLKRVKRDNDDVFDLLHQSNRCLRAYRVCVTRSKHYIVSKLGNSRTGHKSKHTECSNQPARIVYGLDENPCSTSSMSESNDSIDITAIPEIVSSTVASQSDDTLDAIVVHDETVEGSDYYPQSTQHVLPMMAVYSRPDIFPMRTPPLIALQVEADLSKSTNGTLMFADPSDEFTHEDVERLIN